MQLEQLTQCSERIPCSHSLDDVNDEKEKATYDSDEMIRFMMAIQTTMI